MRSAEIGKRTIEFFRQRQHEFVPSASLIADDPTLMLVNAGMVPFKRYFSGDVRPPHSRVTSVQKCVRTVDIEEVGRTSRHGSFFQMLGNFSFDDYFKEEAITYAWDFLTRPAVDGGLGVPEGRLWVTVYVDDDEAEHIWRTKVGVPADRIQRLGMADNFWSMGVPGPCGPSSEIYYDRGPAYGRAGGPAVDDERYLELWNLVFMQNIRGEGPAKDGYPILGDLPSRNIDTGLGLERISMILQGVETIFDIDTTSHIVGLAAELSGTGYDRTSRGDVALRVVADHVLTSVMLIADGVVPANDGRGYVLRRILRRAVRTLRQLGVEERVVESLIERTVDVMSEMYPDLRQAQDRIARIASVEEAAFRETLKAGIRVFDLTARNIRADGSSVFPGDKAFQLHDTYGFPIDLTLEMAAEAGLEVDEAGFRSLMAEQRQRAKEDAQSRKHAHADLTVYKELVDRGATEFTGFDELATEAKVLALIADGVRVPTATAGQDVEVILDRSPLYAESGGQIADRGTITASGLKLRVNDVQKIAKMLWTHNATVESGQITEGDTVLAQVDPAWRYLAEGRALLAGVASALKVPSEEVPARVEQLVERLKVAERELERTKLAAVLSSAGTFVEQAQRVGTVLLVAAAAPEGVGAGDLRTLATDIRGRFGSEPAVVVLLGNADGKVPFVVTVNKPAQELGLEAGDLVAAFGPSIAGRGGGKPEMAQGAGTNASGIDQALRNVRRIVSQAAG